MPFCKSNPPPTQNVTPNSSNKPIIHNVAPPAYTVPDKSKVPRVLLPGISGFVGFTCSGGLIQVLTNSSPIILTICITAGITCLTASYIKIKKLKIEEKNEDSKIWIEKEKAKAELERTKANDAHEREIEMLHIKYELDKNKQDNELERELRRAEAELNRITYHSYTEVQLNGLKTFLERIYEKLPDIFSSLTSDENYNRRMEAVFHTAIIEGRQPPDPESLQIYQELLDNNQLAPLIQLLNQISTILGNDFLIKHYH